MPLSRPPVHVASILALAALAGAAMAVSSAAQDEPASPETSLTVALPRDEVEGLEIRAGDRALEYRALDEVPWQVAIYFDQLLSAPQALRNATVLLSQRAEALRDLGPVEILLGGESVRSALPPSRDAAVISEALSWLRVRESSVDAQAVIREEFVAAMTARELSDNELGELVVESLRREAAAIRVQREGLLLWAAQERRRGPRLLLLAGSGHDAELTGFYRQMLVGAERGSIAVPEQALKPTLPELGQALAVTGWTVLAYAPSDSVDALLAGPELEVAPQAAATPDGRVVQRGVIGFDPKKLLSRRKTTEPDPSAPPPLLLDPLSGLRALGEATAGAVVTDSLVLDRRLEELAWRTVLAVRAPVVGEPMPLAVRARGLAAAVAAPSWIGHGAPAALSAARARFLAASGESADGELQVAALVNAGSPPRLAVELSSTGGGVALRPPLRLTVAEAIDGGTRIVSQRVLDAAQIATGRVDIALADHKAGVDPIIVVVDEIVGNRWGGTFAGFSAQTEAAFQAADGSTLLDLPEAASVRLLAPQDPLLVGRVRFAAAIADPRVARVEFLLDGDQEAVRRSQPFEADLDLGQLPRARRIEVVARDAEGEEIGRDALTVNSGNSELAIQLTAPDAERTAGGSVTATEELWVEAQIDVPTAARVSRVEFFWIDKPIGTLFAPPWRQRVVFPGTGRRGFVRTVVTLDDGSVAEDVLFVNSAGSSARVEVTLVEVLAVVSGPDGRPVADLPREAFTVSEEGDRQVIEAFNNAGEMPLTVGLAVDSSASMFIKLPRVQLAAMDFLDELLNERDRGFVIGFGSEPLLLAPTTGDRDRLVRGIDAMRPEGFTSIWKGIVYSLVQLQGTPGKKALVVYSDGADEDPDFSYRTARRFARVVGVPIYVILSNNEIVRTQGKGLNIRGFLGRLNDLVGDVGGRVYFTRVGGDLEGVYAEIAEELRSQYVLGYYGEQDDDDGWRKIDVEVSVPGTPGLRVRSARGRYP